MKSPSPSQSLAPRQATLSSRLPCRSEVETPSEVEGSESEGSAAPALSEVEGRDLHVSKGR